MEKQMSLEDLLNSFRYVFRFILSKWKYIIIFTILAGLFGYLMASRKKPYYQAMLTFFIDDAGKSGNILGYAALAQQLNLPDMKDFSNKKTLLTELLKSREIFKITLFTAAKYHGKEELIINQYGKIYGFPLGSDSAFIQQGGRFLPSDRFKTEDILVNSMVNIIYKDLLFTKFEIKDRLGGVVEMSFRSHDEEFARNFLDNHIESLLEFYEKERSRKAQASYEFIQNKTDSLVNEVNAVQSALAEFEDSRHRLVKAKGYIEKVNLQRKLEMLNEALAEAIKSLEYSRANLNNTMSIVRVIDRPLLPLDYFRVSTLKYILSGIMLGFFIMVLFYFLMGMYKAAFSKEA